jgi:ABC-2 type transport system ATP-binding protein
MVELIEVVKYFGEKRALGPVTLEIPRGTTVGFLGLNGVGKTTLLRMLACDLRPSSGSVRIDGLDALARPHDVRKRVGYLPERPPVYGEMTVGDYLNFAGRIRGLSTQAVRRRIPEVEELTHLTDVHDELTRNLSQGYRQRVGVAQAIIHEPDLLILDEPTHDLDPVQIREMRELVQSLQDAHTILISSHILPEISQTCDRILILNAGEIIASGTEEELSRKLHRSKGIVVTVRYGGEAPSPVQRAAAGVETALASLPGIGTPEVVGRRDDEWTFRIASERDARADVCRALVETGHDVLRLDRDDSHLETLFVELVGGARA